MQDVDLAKNFVANIKAAKKDGDSWRQIGLRAGIHPVTITRILKGDMTPSLQLCAELAKAMGLREDLAFVEPASTEPPKKVKQPA